MKVEEDRGRHIIQDSIINAIPTPQEKSNFSSLPPPLEGLINPGIAVKMAHEPSVHKNEFRMAPVTIISIQDQVAGSF